jgi:hypothetical protein
VTTNVGAELTAGWETENTTPLDPNEGFFTSIEQAMKDKIERIYVTDRAAGADRRLARVYYRWPQVEVTDQTYPFITLDLLRYYRNASREHRGGDYPLPYSPPNYPLPDDENNQNLITTVEMPIPMDLVFQITAHTRSNYQMREIEFAMLMDERLPPRGGYLVVNDTIRRMEVDGPVNASGMDPQPGGRPKRHFRKVWTTTVETEMFQTQIDSLTAITSAPVINVDLIDQTE